MEQRVANEINSAEVKAELNLLRLAALALAEICNGEKNLYRFARFFREVSEVADTLLQAGATKHELSDLAQNVSSTFNYHPGEFLDLFVERDNYDEMVVANEVFDRVKEQVLTSARSLRSLSNELR